MFPTDPFKRSAFTWKVHERSHLMKLGEGVTVLVETPDLGACRPKKDAPTGPVPVAVTFRVGGGAAAAKRVESGPESGKAVASADASGAVLHVMSHFKDQKTEAGDGFALQQLLLNFIVEKQKGNAALGR